MDQISLTGIKIRLKHLPKTIECGLHSGIPACCIKYYITHWMWILDKGSNSECLNYINKLGAKQVGYIACPSCLENKTFVKIGPCPNNINCWHADEQAL